MSKKITEGMEFNKKYLFFSSLIHVVVLTLFVFSMDTSSTLFVIENTDQHDVVSAVVLGDTAKSKILPVEQTPSSPPVLSKSPPKKQVQKIETKKEEMAIKVLPKKVQKKVDKAIAEKKRQEIFGKNLLADIKKVNDKQNQIKQMQLKSQFQKTLQEQAEQSLRQQLLDEDIKLRGMQTRLSQGEVNKYKALIMQAISENWNIPAGARKSAFCELLIRLAPGGTVIDVQITKTSGDPALDYSARAAVLKASPLPVPTNPDSFAPFRQFVLKAKPLNIISDGVV
jgi:colicin import membrane protein